MRGLVQAGRSAIRPLHHLTKEAVSSAAPSRAPSATGLPPRVVVMKAGRSGQTISLEKSFKSETAERPLTSRGTRSAARGSLIQPHPPANQRDRQAAVSEQLVVEGVQHEARAPGVSDVGGQPDQLPASQQRG